MFRVLIQNSLHKNKKKESRLKIERSGIYLISLSLTSSLFLFWCKEFWFNTLIILLIVYILGKSKHLIADDMPMQVSSWLHTPTSPHGWRGATTPCLATTRTSRGRGSGGAGSGKPWGVPRRTSLRLLKEGSKGASIRESRNAAQPHFSYVYPLGL